MTDMSLPLTRFAVRGTSFALHDPGDTVARETFSSLGYEPAVVDLLDQIADRLPAATFCDVGALHGYYPCLVAARYPGWRVEAFEPNPQAFEVLAGNIHRAGDAHATREPGRAHCLALNETGDSLHFRGRTIVAPDTPDAIIVPGRRFDDLARDLPAGPLVVKIDVHGAEGVVLAGMTACLAGSLPGIDLRAVLIEVHAHHLLVGGHDYEGMLGRLEGAGLEVFEIRDFRDTDTALPVPLTGETRRRFVDPALWTQAQIDRERLILATRPGTFRP